MCLGLLAQTRLDRLQAQLKSENISAAVSQPELTDEAPCDTQLQCPTCTPCTSCVEETVSGDHSSASDVWATPSRSPVGLLRG